MLVYISIGRTLKLFSNQGSTIDITYSSVKLLTSTTNYGTKRSFHYWVVVLHFFFLTCSFAYSIHHRFEQVIWLDRFKQVLWLVYRVLSRWIHTVIPPGSIINSDTNLTSLLFRSGTDYLSFLFLWMNPPITWDVLLPHRHQTIIVDYCCCR